jgi:hypothetical protein
LLLLANKISQLQQQTAENHFTVFYEVFCGEETASRPNKSSAHCSGGIACWRWKLHSPQRQPTMRSIFHHYVNQAAQRDCLQANHRREIYAIGK